MAPQILKFLEFPLFLFHFPHFFFLPIFPNFKISLFHGLGKFLEFPCFHFEYLSDTDNTFHKILWESPLFLIFPPPRTP